MAGTARTSALSSKALGEEGRSRIKTAIRDMSKAFSEEVRHQCPNAEIVYDLFT